MKFLWRWVKRLVSAVVLLVILLLLPVGYTEVACRGTPSPELSRPIITDPDWQRDESRTLTTYPEWHIVHAYDDYAQVISTGDPHEFGFLRAIAGFWTSLCPLARRSAAMGGFTSESKITIYTIGVSFTAELLAKAAYEESLGRIATWIRGPDRTELDYVQAQQAADYARFLQQTPWYKWDFRRASVVLFNRSSDIFRDREREYALGLEYRVKAAYADVIASAVDEIGQDELRIRSIIQGISTEELSTTPTVRVIEETAKGTLIETDRYRAFTHLLQNWAARGGNMVEIAGNDEILFTAISDQETLEEAFYSFPRQGYDDWRHLVIVPVPELLNRIRNLDGARLEHVHDY